MSLSAMIYAFRCLAADTFRQALASKVHWMILVINLIAIGFCLSVRFEGGTIRADGEIYGADGDVLIGQNPTPGRVTFLFGALPYSMPRGAEEMAQLIMICFATWVAGAAGLLFALAWTASFLPDFLQPSSATVLFAKPIPRRVILTGKYLGVTLYVTTQAMVFFVGTWAALGLATGQWVNAYLWGLPLFVLQFAVFYSFSTLLAATWRNTTACILGVVGFWAMSLAMNSARHGYTAMPRVAPTDGPRPSQATAFFVEVGYWLFPKPADFQILLEDAMNAERHQGTLSTIPAFGDGLDFAPGASIFVSLLFVGVLLALSGHELSKIEY